MQSGLPCLCSNIGGIPEFVSDEEIVWLFNPNNSIELNNKIKSNYCHASIQRNIVGFKGQQFVKDSFTTEKYINHLENFYQKLI